MEEIRSWWEVPCIAHYCNIFKKAFKFPQIEIEELEDAILLDSSPSKLMVQLFCIFLNGIVDKDITEENWEFFLKLHFEWRCEHLGQKWNPFSGEKDYKDLSRRQKLEILHKLCHWRLELDDIADLLRSVDGPSLRVYPVGKDSNGNMYWHFFGMRLYKEQPKRRKKTEPLKDTPGTKKGRGKGVSTPRTVGRGRSTPGRNRMGKGDNESTPSRQSKGRSNNGKGTKAAQCNVEDGLQDDKSECASDDLEASESELPCVVLTGWSVVCYSLEDWNELTESFSGAKQKDVKSLYNGLCELLPHIEYLAQIKERDDKKKLLASAPRRTSDRIAIKAAEKDDLEQLLAIERELEREELRQINAEEEKQAEEEAEKKRQEKREEAIKRRKAREEQQAKQREAEDENWEKAMSGELSGKRQAAIGASKNVSEVTLLGEHLLAEEKNELDTAMFKIVNGLRNQEDSWVFEDPVTEAIAPGYFEVVDKPMDYSTVEKKIEGHHYKAKEEFVEDIELIYSNCIEYNGDDSEYAELAKEMKTVFIGLQRVHFDGEPEVEDDDERSRKKKKRDTSHSPSPDITSESSVEEESEDSDVSYEEGMQSKKKRGTKELTTKNVLKLPPGFNDKLGVLRPPHLPPQMNPHMYHQLIQQRRMQSLQMFPHDEKFFTPRLPPPYPGPMPNGPMMRPPMYRPNPDMRHMYPVGMYPDGRPMYPPPPVPHHPMAHHAYQQMMLQRGMAPRGPHRHTQSPRHNTGLPPVPPPVSPTSNPTPAVAQRQSSSPHLLAQTTESLGEHSPANSLSEKKSNSELMSSPISSPRTSSGAPPPGEGEPNPDGDQWPNQSNLNSTRNSGQPLPASDKQHLSQPDPRQQQAEQYDRYRHHMMMAMQQPHQPPPGFSDGGYGYPGPHRPPMERIPEEMAYHAWHQQQQHGAMYHQELDYIHQQQQRYWHEMEMRQRQAYEAMMRQRFAQGMSHHSETGDKLNGSGLAQTHNGPTAAATKPEHTAMLSAEGNPQMNVPHPFDNPQSLNGLVDQGPIEYPHQPPFPPNGHHHYGSRPPPPFFPPSAQIQRFHSGPEDRDKHPSDLSTQHNGEQGSPPAKKLKTESNEES